jgi:predicted oxidoreductase
VTNLIDVTPRNLGNSCQVGALGYGCWRLVNMTAKAAQARIECALGHGMNLIDTADVYGLDWGGDAFGAAEKLLGEVLHGAPELRGQMVLASKGGIIPGIPYDSAYLEQACNDSLGRLQVEQLDLYQVHRPDMLCHPEETARVLETLVSSGRVVNVGVSNYNPSQTEALMAYLPGGIISQQSQYSALHLDPLFDGTFDQCMKHNQLMMAWSPLAGGRLSEHSDQGGVSSDLLDVLDRLAEREGVTRATLCLDFALAHPARPVALVGSIDTDRIAQAKDALNVRLDRSDVYQIIEASTGQPLP